MSIIKTAKIPAWRDSVVNVEIFESAAEVVELSGQREITDHHFENKRTGKLDKDWSGVGSWEEAERYMREGYQPTVDALRKGEITASISSQAKRFSFRNDVVGFAPIVPNAILGLPNSMINGSIKPIKSKVLDVYYDMTCSCGVSKDDIIKAGQTLLGAILELEMQGYRINLYAIQSYSESRDADILVTKIKNSNSPLDLKRISFPLTHTAYFRVIGFDWYSRFPKGRYRCAYGHGLSYEWNEKQLREGYAQLFGKEHAVVFSASRILNVGKEHLKNVMTGNENNEPTKRK